MRLQLLGEVFFGTNLDTQKFTATLGGSGAVTLAGGFAQIATNPVGTTANSSAILASNDVARFVAGYEHRLTMFTKLNNAGTANNVRRWGGYDASDGFFLS